MSDFQVYVVQRPSDRQWTWRIFANNGKKVGWAGEHFQRKAAVLRVVDHLFGDRHQVFVSPAAKGKP